VFDDRRRDHVALSVAVRGCCFLPTLNRSAKRTSLRKGPKTHKPRFGGAFSLLGVPGAKVPKWNLPAET
jgi:hypothetical protein